jgi:tight adherence protein C
MVPILFFVAMFATVVALLWSGYHLFHEQEDPLGDRLEEMQANAVSSTRQSAAPRRKGGGGVLNSFLYFVSMVPGGDGWLRDTERELAQAGIRNKVALGAYSLGQTLFMVILIVAMLWFQRDNDMLQRFVAMTAAFILGWLIPPQVLHRLVARYRTKLKDALPDTVDMLGIVLGTGLALDQAMLRVSEEMEHIYPELAAEFMTVVMQVKAGQERAKSFAQLVRRTGIEDLKSLSAMIVQSERFGTSLSQALRVYSDDLRERRKLRAEAQVAKAGIKMLFPIVLFILPVLFVITLVPGVLSVLHDLRGGIGAK